MITETRYPPLKLYSGCASDHSLAVRLGKLHKDHHATYLRPLFLELDAVSFDMYDGMGNHQKTQSISSYAFETCEKNTQLGYNYTASQLIL